MVIASASDKKVTIDVSGFQGARTGVPGSTAGAGLVAPTLREGKPLSLDTSMDGQTALSSIARRCRVCRRALRRRVFRREVFQEVGVGEGIAAAEPPQEVESGGIVQE